MSIVVAVYNGEKYLGDQLRSLQDQDHPALEIVIVDDASQDNSLEVARRSAARDPRLRVHENRENLGIAANFLKGLSLTQGPYVCFCDQDDVWRSDKVSLLKQLLEKDPRNLAAYSDLEICDEALRSTHTSFWKAAGIRPRGGHLGEKALLRNLAPGCSMMFRGRVRDLLKNAPQNPPFVHDHLVFAISAVLGRLVYTRESLVKYRQHGRNNIGAFYPSVMDRGSFVADLQKKVEASMKIFGGEPPELKKILDFCRSWKEEPLRSRAAYLDYYLFMRNDDWTDKLLGVAECLMPRAYHWLRNRART